MSIPSAQYLRHKFLSARRRWRASCRRLVAEQWPLRRSDETQFSAGPKWETASDALRFQSIRSRITTGYQGIAGSLIVRSGEGSTLIAPVTKLSSWTPSARPSAALSRCTAGWWPNHRMTRRADLARAVMAFVDAVKRAFPFLAGAYWQHLRERTRGCG